MAPKKKLKAGKNIKGSSGIIDGISVSEMSREQLESFVLRIQQELEREREERNFFQLERDKIKTFWEITRQQLEENRACLRNKDRELEETEEKHQKDIKIYQQKVKHLMYEQEIKITAMKVENMVVLKNAERDFLEQELQLLNDKRELKSKISEKEESHLCQLRMQIIENNNEVSKIRSEYKNNCRALEYKYQTYLEEFKTEMELINEMEVTEIEERKNSHINKLSKSHEKMYEEIIKFYTEITAKILALVSNLKDKLLIIKKEKCQMMKEMQDVRNQNQKLIAPLKIARETTLQLQHKIDIYERDKKCFSVLQKLLNELHLKYENLQHSYDSLNLSFEKIQEEKENVISKLIDDFTKVEQKTLCQNLIFEQKILELKNVIEFKEDQIIDFIVCENENNFTMENSKYKNLLNEKNNKIASLVEDLSTMIKTQNNIIPNYKNIIELHSVC